MISEKYCTEVTWVILQNGLLSGDQRIFQGGVPPQRMSQMRHFQTCGRMTVPLTVNNCSCAAQHKG